MRYPVTKKIPYVDKYMRNEVIDDYAWLTDASSNEAQAWLKQQHDFTDAYFSSTGEHYQNNVKKVKEMSDSFSIRSLSYNHGQYIGVVDDPKSGLAVFVGSHPEQRTLLQTAGNPYTTIFSAEFSPTDASLYAFAGYYQNETRVSINVAEYPSQKVIARFGFGFDHHWSDDGQYIYYSVAVVQDDDPTQSKQEIYRYNVANNHSELLYVFDDNAVYVEFGQSGDVIIARVVTDYHNSQLLVIKSDGSVTPLTDVLPYSYEYIGTIDGKQYFITDEGVDGKRIAKADWKKGWESREFLPQPQAFELSAKVVTNRIVAFAKQDAEDIGVLYNQDGKQIALASLPSEYASVHIISDDKARNLVYLLFESISHPESVLSFDVQTNSSELLWSLSNDPIASDLEVRKERVVLRDGETSVVYLVLAKGQTVDSESPLLVYGYGGYGASLSLQYRDSMTNYTLSEWTSFGGVYASVILRGGAEYGKKWHDAGRLDKKQNTFNDLFDLTEAVHKMGISSPKRTVLVGMSNGGLLVSAAFTMRPDLYACIIDSVGLNDMLHFAKDPRGSMYQTEYGNPFEDEMFHYLKGYSPYHNTTTNPLYPAIYIHSGLLDTNVPPYHGMKFAAKIQTLNPDGAPALLRVLPHGHHDYGHGEERIVTIAERQTFIEQCLGLK